MTEIQGMTGGIEEETEGGLGVDREVQGETEVEVRKGQEDAVEAEAEEAEARKREEGGRVLQFHRL